MLHVCCAPCAIHPLKILHDQEGSRVVSYFSNFNIHPLSEFLARLQSFEKLSDEWGLESVVDYEYGLEKFLDAVGERRQAPGRCAACYSVRMNDAAQKAKELACDAFTTTLLVSPHQPQDLIRDAAEAAERAHGVEFAYRDFRPGFGEIRSAAGSLGLYMQKYCGCIFSERERFEGKLRRAAERGLKRP